MDLKYSVLLKTRVQNCQRGVISFALWNMLIMYGHKGGGQTELKKKIFILHQVESKNSDPGTHQVPVPGTLAGTLPSGPCQCSTQGGLHAFLSSNTHPCSYHQVSLSTDQQQQCQDLLTTVGRLAYSSLWIG